MMELSAPELGVLRALDQWSAKTDPDSANSADSLDSLGSLDSASLSAMWGGVTAGLLACQTPAWTECHVRILDRLITKLGRRAEVATDALPLGTLLALHGLRSMVLANHHRAGRRGATGPGEDAAPDPDELAVRAAEFLRQGDLAIPLSMSPEGTVPSGMSKGRVFKGLLEGVTLGLGLWLYDRHHHTDWHVRCFGAWWATAASSASTVVGSQAAALAWFLTPQAPAAAEPLLERMWLNDPPSAAADPSDTSAVETLAMQVLVATEWSLTQAPALREQLLAALLQASAGAGDGQQGAGQQRDEPLWGPGDGAAKGAAAVAGAPGSWEALCRAPLAASAQVIDVDFPMVAFTRAEWINGFLHVGLDVQDAQSNTPGEGVASSRRTTFRIVGAEPRVWWASGMANITTEMSATAVSITVPLMSGTIEFAPSSY